MLSRLALRGLLREAAEGGESRASHGARAQPGRTVAGVGEAAMATAELQALTLTPAMRRVSGSKRLRCGALVSVRVCS